MRRIALLLLCPSIVLGFGLPQLSHLHDDFSPGAVVYLTAGTGALMAETTESLSQITYYQAGTFSKFWLNVPINTLTASSVCTIRINGINGNETVTVGSGATGTFTDNTHTDHVSAGALVDFQCTMGASGTSLRIQGNMVQFTPDSSIWMMKWMSSTWPSSVSGTGQSNGYGTYYEVPVGLMGNGGGFWANQTESNVYYLMHSAGTFQNMSVNISANGRTENIPFYLRKNGVNVMTVNVPSGQTGIWADTTDTSHVVAGDTVTYEIGMNNGSDTNTIAASYLSADFIPDGNVIELPSNCSGGHSMSAGTYQSPYFSVLSWGGNEYLVPVYTAGTLGQLSSYILANTMSGSTTISLNRNGTLLNSAVVIPAGATGEVFGTGSDVLAMGDLIDYSITAVGSGSITLSAIGASLNTGSGSSSSSKSFSGGSKFQGAGTFQ